MEDFRNIFPQRPGATPYTQRNLFEILLNQTEIRLYLPFSDWFGTKLTSVWFQINRNMVNTIWYRFDLIRFGKDISVYRFFKLVASSTSASQLNRSYGYPILQKLCQIFGLTKFQRFVDRKINFVFKSLFYRKVSVA